MAFNIMSHVISGWTTWHMVKQSTKVDMVNVLLFLEKKVSVGHLKVQLRCSITTSKHLLKRTRRINGRFFKILFIQVNSNILFSIQFRTAYPCQGGSRAAWCHFLLQISLTLTSGTTIVLCLVHLQREACRRIL